MSDFIFLFFIVFVIAGLIYFMYTLMSSSEKGNKDNELQITSDELVEQISILHKQKKYNIVENLAKNYLELKRSDDGVRIILTKSLYNSGKIHDAIEQAKIIIGHQPHNFEMQVFIANCYMEIEKPTKAITVLKHILGEDANNVIAIKELAQIYFKTNQKRSAIKMYEMLEDFLDSNQEKVKNKIIRAEIHSEFKEFDLAIKEYEQILEIYPEDISVKKRLIELYKTTSEYELLIKLANEIAETHFADENGLWAMTTLMETYSVMKNYEFALEYANLIKAHPLADAAHAEEDITQILLNEGRIDEGIELLNELINGDSENIRLKKMLARAYEMDKNFKAVILLYNEILDIAKAEDIKQIHFELSNIYSNWAMHLFSQNDSEKCFEHFTTALKYCNQNPCIYYLLGTVNKLIKNFNESILQYKKAIELDSQTSEYYYALAECYEEIDSIYEQQKALIECLKYNPENAHAHYKLGLLYEVQKDQNNAMLHIGKAVNADANLLDAKRKLALMLEHTGDIEGAIKLYEDILCIDPQNEEILNNLKMLA